MMISIQIKHTLTLLFITLMTACNQSQNEKKTTEPINQNNNNWSINKVTEFKRGDFIVKPNLNFLPGSASIPNGNYFGHAAIVTKGFIHQNTDTLLANIKIIESMALDVPKEFQVREIAAYVYNKNPILSCTSFKKQFEGNRYRLRLELNDAQIDSIISFACDQKGDFSTWNATKNFPDTFNKKDKTNWADNSYWYCSLLVWQSVYYVTGIDIDINKGFQVYPNDLIANPVFDNTDTRIGRARF